MAMVTIRQIAKSVGVSPATVSRVLNYDATLSITETKRQAIIETAEKLNYITPRNRQKARAVQSAEPAATRIAIIHFLRPDQEMADPYYVGVRMGVEARARQNRVELTVFYHGHIPDDPSALQGITGVISLGMQTDAEIEHVRKLGFHLVLADFAPESDLFDTVSCDLRLAMLHLLDALHDAGHRRFGFIGDDRPSGNLLYPANEERARTFRDWAERRGLFHPEHYLLGDRLCFENGYTLTRRILESRDRPEILVTSNDNMAIGAYRAIQEKGLAIPDDIAVASFNDIPSAQFMAPPLTTVRIPADHIGETAFDLLAERMAGRDYAKRVLLPTKLIWRDSCRRPSTSVTDVTHRDI